jgi:hypothetical protein
MEKSASNRQNHNCHPEIKVSSGEIQAQVINEIIKFTLSLTFDSNEIPERKPKNNNHFFFISSLI